MVGSFIYHFHDSDSLSTMFENQLNIQDDRLNHTLVYGSLFSITPNFNMGKSPEFENLAENRRMCGLSMA